MKAYELQLKEFQHNEMTKKMFPMEIALPDKPVKGELILVNRDTLVIMDIIHTPDISLPNIGIEQNVKKTILVVQFRQ